MIAGLAVIQLLQGEARAVDLTLDLVVFHENTADLDVLFPADGADQLSAWSRALEAILEADPSFPEGDTVVVDALVSAGRRPALSLHEGRTAKGARWTLPDTSALPDLRLRGGEVPVSLVLRAPGGPSQALAPRTWLERLPADLDLAQLDAAITARARDYALPFLALSASDVDPRFEGVRRVGELVVQQQTSGAYDARALYADPGFWRGMVEMVPGNPLVEAAPVLVQIASGRWESAQVQLQLYAALSNDDSLVTNHLRELSTAWGRLEAARTAMIRQGIALEDSGDHAGAIAQYDRVLALTPCSAWARYERGFSLRAQGGLDAPEAMEQQNQSVFACDPLYPMALEAHGAEQVRAMQWRLSLNGLVSGEGDLAEELVRYADAALELGQPGIAGQLYVMASRARKPARKPDQLMADVLLAATEAGAAGFAQLFDDGDRMLADARARRAKRTR